MDLTHSNSILLTVFFMYGLAGYTVLYTYTHTHTHIHTHTYTHAHTHTRTHTHTHTYTHDCSIEGHMYVVVSTISVIVV